MGFTFDIGQGNIDVVECVASHYLGNDTKKCEVFWDCASGWCYKHDQNILVGICGCCGNDDSMAAYIAAAKELAVEVRSL